MNGEGTRPSMTALMLLREVSRFTDRMLGQRGVRTAVWARNRRTVAQCPHLGMAAASHRGVDRDPATLVADDRDGARDGARDDARRQDDGAGVDGVVLEPHAPGLDRPDSGRDLDVNPATLEHARRRGRQLRVDLRQNPRAGLEQPEADLVAPDARIEAQHVVGKRRELTHQFYADQSAADHDDCETPAPLGRVRGCVRAFEAFDQVISQHQRIRHRLERQGVRRAGNQSVVRRRAKRDHQMVVGQAVRAAFGSHGSNELSFEVNRFDGGFDEAGALKGGADGLRAMSQLQPAGACLEQERREHEEVLAAHESDLDICSAAAGPSRGVARSSRHRIRRRLRQCACSLPNRLITSERDR